MNFELERKIRNIIKNNYGFGNQSIASEEIYDKLVAAGEEVPELAMYEIFRKLKKEGLVRGPGYMNRDAAHKHGAFSIMWVSRYI
jgi:hypothetical protein